MKKQVDGQLTLSQAGFPASPYLSPGSAEAVTMTVSSGRKCLEWYRNSGPLGYVVKTLLESSAWRSTIVLLTWKIRVTPLKSCFFQLAPSTPRTDGTELLLWPTITASDAGRGGSAEAWMEYKEHGRTTQSRLRNAVQMFPAPTATTAANGNGTAPQLWATPNTMDCLPPRSKESLMRMANTTRKGRTRPANLREQVDPETMKLWPTPRANKIGGYSSPDFSPTPEQAVMYPTPTTGAGLCGGSGNFRQLKELEASGEITPEESRSMASGSGGQLNPDWVEALMGFPAGWTALEPDGGTEAGKTESPESQKASRTE